MKHAERTAVLTMERELEPDRERNLASANARRASRTTWAQVARLLLLVVVGAIVLLGIVDSALAWKTKSALSGAARAAAEVTIVTPLTAKDCEGTPCSIESAATAAKTFLVKAGYRDANCIDPEKPSFSGVLVWAFSCHVGAETVDAAHACGTSEGSVCLKIDMTPSQLEPNGKLAGYTRATVEYPHASMVAFILRALPERLRPRMPASVDGSALLRDSF